MKQQSSLRPQEVLTDLYIGLLLTVFLLWPGRGGYAAIQQSKTSLYNALTMGYLSLMALLTAETLLIGRLKWKDLGKPTATQKLILLYWGITVLSTVLSDYRIYAIRGISRDEGLLTITLYCAAFLCVSAFARPKGWMGWLLGGSMTVFDLICLLQLAGRNPLGLFPEGLTYYDANVRFAGVYLGPSGNIGLTGAICCLAVPVLLGVALCGRGKGRWLCLIPAAMSLWIVVHTRIQASMLGLGLGLLLGSPMLLPKGSKGRKVCMMLVAAALVIGLVLVYHFPGDYGALYELRRVMHGDWDPMMGNGRIHIWKEVLARVPDHLWLGTGPDTMAAYGIEGHSWLPSGSSEAVQMGIDVAHNEYLNILFHQGILGLTAYMAALLRSAIGWIRSDNRWAAILGTGILCYSIQIFFSFSMHIAAAFFWLLWALLENQCAIREEEK